MWEELNNLLLALILGVAPIIWLATILLSGVTWSTLVPLLLCEIVAWAAWRALGCRADLPQALVPHDAPQL